MHFGDLESKQVEQSMYLEQPSIPNALLKTAGLQPRRLL